MIVVIICFIIVLLLFILLNKNSENFFTSKPKSKIILNKNIKVDNSVFINRTNLFNNNMFQQYDDNGTNTSKKSNFTLKGKLNVPINTKIKVGNKDITAQKIRDYKENIPCKLELPNDISVIGTDYKASSPGLWTNAHIETSATIPKVDVVTRTGGEDTEQIESVGGVIAEDIKQKECIGSNPKNRYNKYYNDATLKSLEYPGCDDYCCSSIEESEQIIYDKLCIGDTCINGEDLKILKGEKMLSLRSKINNKCISYPDVQQGTPSSWPTFAEILTNNDCIEYKQHPNSNCMPNSNIGDYKKGSISDAKNECNQTPDCVGFEYKYDSNNTLDNRLWKRAFREIPTGKYALKNNIIKSEKSSSTDKSACFINPRSKLNNEINTNNIYYQMVLSNPVDVKVTIPTKINKVLEEEVRDISIARELEQSQQTALQNQINNYNLQERQIMEAEYPPPVVMPQEYIWGIPVYEWDELTNNDGW